MRMKVLLIVTSIFALGVTSLYGADAVDQTPAPVGKVENPALAMAREKIGREEYEEAIVHLKKALKEDDKNADIYNLLGYSHRKLNRLDSSYDYYQKALKLDPKHRRAHEYLGELYLQKGDLEKAQKQLAILDDLCFWGCDEFKQLNAAIKKFRKKQ